MPKHNATRHGAYAHDIVLPWEDQKEFATLYESFRRDLNPLNALQEEAVRELAGLHWRKRRLGWGQMLLFYKDPTPRELMKVAKEGVKKLGHYLGNHIPVPKGAITAREEIAAIPEGRMSNSDDEDAAKRRKPPPPDPITKTMVTLAYEPAMMEQQLKIEAMIESRITKVMARLVALKEYERLYNEKTLPAPSPRE